MRYVVGAGNYLMGDDGIGPRLIEALRDRGPDPTFEPWDIGNDGLKLLSLFESRTEKIVVVDCVLMGKQAGNWCRFTPEEVRSTKRVDGLTSHAGDLALVVELGRRAGLPVPPLVFLGIEPGSVTPSLELSPPLADRFDDYLEAALEEVRRPV